MNSAEFRASIDQLHERLVALTKSKGEEYKRRDDNQFANFERAAKDMGLTREQVLLVFLCKHMNSITTFVRDKARGEDHEYAEPITGRIDDAILYLLLLRGMVVEPPPYQLYPEPIIAPGCSVPSLAERDLPGWARDEMPAEMHAEVAPQPHEQRQGPPRVDVVFAADPAVALREAGRIGAGRIGVPTAHAIPIRDFNQLREIIAARIFSTVLFCYDARNPQDTYLWNSLCMEAKRYGFGTALLRVGLPG